MKITILIFALISIVSCQQTDVRNTKTITSKIRYFKDARTGLCFGAVHSMSSSEYSVSSITCVPCDSLKNIAGLDRNNPN